MLHLSTPPTSLYARFRYARLAFWANAVSLLIALSFTVASVGCESVPAGAEGDIHFHIGDQPGLTVDPARMEIAPASPLPPSGSLSGN